MCLYCRENIQFSLIFCFRSCFRKQPPEIFCNKRCFQKFHKIHKKRPVPLKRPWHSCFPVNFAKYLRTPFLQNTSGRLLLRFVTFLLFIRRNFILNCICPKQQQSRAQEYLRIENATFEQLNISSKQAKNIVVEAQTILFEACQKEHLHKNTLWVDSNTLAFLQAFYNLHTIRLYNPYT